jgi:hypothetical protein
LARGGEERLARTRRQRTHDAARGCKIQGAMSGNSKYKYTRDEEIQ